MPSTTTVRTRARQLLGDEDTPYRWDSTKLDGYIDSAVGEVYDLRPDEFLTTAGTIEAAPGTVTTLNAKWTQPLAEYAAGKALMEDNADIENVQMGQAYLKAFRQFCKGIQA